jgi:hypothetical protein
VRLDIGVRGAVKRLDPVAGEVLRDVDELAASVVPLAGYPSAYLFVSTLPCASSTARGAKFSLAIISKVPRWRPSSAGEDGGELRVDLGQGSDGDGLRGGALGGGARGLVEHEDSCGVVRVRRVRQDQQAQANDPWTTTPPLPGGDPPERQSRRRPAYRASG